MRFRNPLVLLAASAVSAAKGETASFIIVSPLVVRTGVSTAFGAITGELETAAPADIVRAGTRCRFGAK